MITKEEILSHGFELENENSKTKRYKLILGGTEVLRLSTHENDYIEISHLNTAKAFVHYSIAFDTVFRGWIKTKEDLVKVLNMVCNFVHPLITYSEQSVTHTKKTDLIGYDFTVDPEAEDVKRKLGYK